MSVAQELRFVRVEHAHVTMRRPDPAPHVAYEPREIPVPVPLHKALAMADTMQVELDLYDWLLAYRQAGRVTQ